ncbi:MAG: TetR/AcrR family transcriptional regulator [Chloroflexi bacterium]|nr:TetR/AcrR family transcriptional regulator [Chloroflexota bacterium]
MPEYNQTEERIIAAALKLFMSQGIKKTPIEDVAARCGLTRATIYRYFRDKKFLVRSSMMHMVTVINEALTDLDKHREYTTEKSADRIKEAVTTLPHGDLPARLSELKQVYPDIFAEYQIARLASIRDIYRRVLNTAKKEGLVQPSEADWNLVQAILSEATLYIAESPLVLSHGAAIGKIYSTILDIMLYGIVGRRKK